MLAPWGLHRHLLPGQSQQTNAASLASSIFKLFSLFSMSELEIEVQCAIKEIYFRILELRHTNQTYTGIHVPSMLRPLSPLEARHPPSQQAHERSAEGGHPPG